jgi:hypothetical protein
MMPCGICKPCLLYMALQAEDYKNDVSSGIYKDVDVCLSARIEAAFQLHLIQLCGRYDRLFIDSIKADIAALARSEVHGHG